MQILKIGVIQFRSIFFQTVLQNVCRSVRGILHNCGVFVEEDPQITCL
jgi:hypothetical protein